MDEDEVPDLIDASEECMDADATKRVPVTLICGFLGAGKSTLLKRILTKRHGYRIAVIMNEFGDSADIEAQAIKVSSAEDGNDSLEQMPEEFIELANGCLCCSIKDNGIAAIEKLMARKGAFDYILLETTGLADPGPIAAMFWQNEEFATGTGKEVYLDGVICVVDAVFAEKQIQEDALSDGINHSLRQIAAADVLLLNKSDLPSEADLAKTESTLRRLNPSIPIYRTVRAQIDLSYVIGLGAYNNGPRAFLEVTPHTHAASDGCLDPVHVHGPERHAGISNILVELPDPLNDGQMTALDEWVRCVLWENSIPHGASDVEASAPEYPPSEMPDAQRLLPGNVDPDGTSDLGHQVEVLRCKGIWWNQSGEQFILQGVRNLYEISKTQETAPVETDSLLTGKLIFIGRGLDKTVERSLRETVIGSA